MATSIEVINEDGIYKVEVSEDELPVDEMFEKLIEPVLRAAGYGDSSIDEYLGRKEKDA